MGHSFDVLPTIAASVTLTISGEEADKTLE